jgi:hypothetical protein
MAALTSGLKGPFAMWWRFPSLIWLLMAAGHANEATLWVPQSCEFRSAEFVDEG